MNIDESKLKLYLSFQLGQVGNLHELRSSVLVPDRLGLVAPDDTFTYTFDSLHTSPYLRKELEMVFANLETVDISSSFE